MGADESDFKTKYMKARAASKQWERRFEEVSIKYAADIKALECMDQDVQAERDAYYERERRAYEAIVKVEMTRLTEQLRIAVEIAPLAHKETIKKLKEENARLQGAIGEKDVIISNLENHVAEETSRIKEAKRALAAEMKQAHQEEMEKMRKTLLASHQNERQIDRAEFVKVIATRQSELEKARSKYAADLDAFKTRVAKLEADLTSARQQQQKQQKKPKVGVASSDNNNDRTVELEKQVADLKALVAKNAGVHAENAANYEKLRRMYGDVITKNTNLTNAGRRMHQECTVVEQKNQDLRLRAQGAIAQFVEADCKSRRLEEQNNYMSDRLVELEKGIKEAVTDADNYLEARNESLEAENKDLYEQIFHLTQDIRAIRARTMFRESVKDGIFEDGPRRCPPDMEFSQLVVTPIATASSPSYKSPGNVSGGGGDGKGIKVRIVECKNDDACVTGSDTESAGSDGEPSVPSATEAAFLVGAAHFPGHFPTPPPTRTKKTKRAMK